MNLEPFISAYGYPALGIGTDTLVRIAEILDPQIPPANFERLLLLGRVHLQADKAAVRQAVLEVRGRQE